MPEVLEAAHIKDYANNIKERYDLNNGITLRVDIHRAFDREIFTIKNNKVILIADKIQDPFINELIHYIPLANDYLQQMKNRGIEISR
jgi:predicted restriction endonuclease